VVFVQKNLRQDLAELPSNYPTAAVKREERNLTNRAI
jgi:hypothetical protein